MSTRPTLPMAAPTGGPTAATSTSTLARRKVHAVAAEAAMSRFERAAAAAAPEEAALPDGGEWTAAVARGRRELAGALRERRPRSRRRR